MKTFTAKVILPDNKVKYIPNCILYKGKIVSIVKKGVGTPRIVGGMFNGEGDAWEEYDKYVDKYRLYINASLMEKNNLTREEAEKLLKNEEEALKDERIFNCLFVLGENEGGKYVYNEEEEKELKADKQLQELLKKERPISCDIGIFGLTMERVPAEIWSIVKPFAIYHKGNEEDIEWAEDMGFYECPRAELQGWFFEKDAVKALLNAGYQIKYRDREVLSILDVDKINEEIYNKNEKIRQAREDFRAEKSRLLKTMWELFNSGEYISSEAADIISKSPKIYFEKAGISGANIYGGGVWLHRTNDALYIVKNNGHDGDDWRQNNYPTGGAGAIAMKVNITPEVLAFLAELETFEKKSIEDYK